MFLRDWQVEENPRIHLGLQVIQEYKSFFGSTLNHGESSIQISRAKHAKGIFSSHGKKFRLTPGRLSAPLEKSLIFLKSRPFHSTPKRS